MTKFIFNELFNLGEEEIKYRLVDSDYVEITKFKGNEFLCVEAEGLTKLASEAYYDTAHFLREDHLKQLVTILGAK